MRKVPMGLPGSTVAARCSGAGIGAIVGVARITTAVAVGLETNGVGLNSVAVGETANQSGCVLVPLSVSS